MKIKTLLLAALSTVALAGCCQMIGAGEHYETKHSRIGTVTDVKDCRISKRRYTCYVKLDTNEEYQYMSFRNWPGQNISVGDELGYTYKIGHTVVERWRTNSRMSTMMWDTSCTKSLTDCRYPGK